MTHTVFITGGASGIGFGIAEFLGQQGHRILVADINEQRTAHVKSYIFKAFHVVLLF